VTPYKEWIVIAKEAEPTAAIHEVEVVDNR